MNANLRNILDEPKRIWCRLFGSYRRWHRIYMEYCVQAVDDVDFATLSARLVYELVRDGKRPYALKEVSSLTISQLAFYEYQDDWVVWNAFLTELQDNQERMTMDVALRLIAMVHALEYRRKGIAQKKRSRGV